MASPKEPKPFAPTAFDRLLIKFWPARGLHRLQARAAAETFVRGYEAAQRGRRTRNWHRDAGDANAVNGPALFALRIHTRNLVQNNGWAKRGLNTIANHTVGWGIVPRPLGGSKRANATAREIWKAWAGTPKCDFDGRMNFYGIQRQVIRGVAESGEMLVRRRWMDKASAKGEPIPLQLQVLEPDFIDTAKEEDVSGGGSIVQGVEFDARGQRVAYWLFDEHPGSSTLIKPDSKRIPAEDILHVYSVERAGQVRGVSWFAPVIVTLKDFDEFEDATLLKQKIAACFTVFVTDVTATPSPLGEQSTTNPLIETLEPGMISRMRPGQDVKFADPPSASDHEGFSKTQLRKAAAGIGVSYEDLTGDYSQVNFSSARMSRLEHWTSVRDWQWNMLIPQLCDGAWGWFMEGAQFSGAMSAPLSADWTTPPMPMVDPDKEATAAQRRVRIGQMTHDEMIREQGGDPDTHWEEYAEGVKRLKELEIVLDSDASETTQAGNPRDMQQDPAAPSPEEAAAERALSLEERKAKLQIEKVITRKLEVKP